MIEFSMGTAAATRVILDSTSIPPTLPGGWNERGRWRANWISANESAPVVAFRLAVHCAARETVRIHTTADERYELYLDGEMIGRGPDRGDVAHWHYESYDLELSEGDHIVVAKVCSLGELAPFAQHSLRHGFLLYVAGEQGARWSTGQAAWTAKPIDGYTLTSPQAAWGTGGRIRLDGSRFPWGFELGLGEGWKPVQLGPPAVSVEGRNDQFVQHLLLPSTLPGQRYEPWPASRVRVRSAEVVPSGPIGKRPIREDTGFEEPWRSLFKGVPLTIAPHQRVRVLLDLDDYVCAIHELQTTGGEGASVRICWQEALFEKADSNDKGNRDHVDGKFFNTIWEHEEGVGDTFLPHGGSDRRFRSLWWHAGRFVELVVETSEQPLTLQSLTFWETRYPFENRSQFSASDPSLEKITPIAFRTLQMCSHETYMDCPYYEQLQYVGDTRLQVLTSYATTGDDRLARNALRLFDWSRLSDGITFSRYPSRIVQVIPPFSLWWIEMVHDFARWRGDKEFVRSLMPGVRAIIDWFMTFRNHRGLVEGPMGWNFVDWVPGWDSGMPPGADKGESHIINRQFEIALRSAAELEGWLGEIEMNRRWLRHANGLHEAIERAFYDREREMYADDLLQTSWSEHSQCLAILSGALRPERRARVMHRLVTEKNLHRATIYFRHYLFETLRLGGHVDLILQHLDQWRDLAKSGLRTTIEMPEPTRSDCHAWGAYPLYHYQATILGIRPVGLGARHWEVAPQLGGLEWAHGTMPLGDGEFRVKVEGGRVEVEASKHLGIQVRIESPTGGFENRQL